MKINTTGTTNPVSIDLDLSEYEKEVLRAIKLARDIQDFIWSDESWANKPFDPQTWAPVFQKRVDCLMEIKTDHASWKVESRKRLLQQASLSIKAIMALTYATT
jgi:hypothetical protein